MHCWEHPLSPAPLVLRLHYGRNCCSPYCETALLAFRAETRGLRLATSLLRTVDTFSWWHLRQLLRILGTAA